MKEVFLVCEILNDYILGIYTTELYAITGIFKSLEDEIDSDDSDYSYEELLECNVCNDFRIYRIPPNFELDLVPDARDSEGFNKMSARVGEEIKTLTYIELLERKRELAIVNIIG